MDPGRPGPLNLIFVYQFKWATYNNISMVPNTNIDPGSQGPLNLIFVNQFKWAPYNNI